MSRQTAQAMTQLDVINQIASSVKRAQRPNEYRRIRTVDVRSEHRAFITLADGRSYQLFLQGYRIVSESQSSEPTTPTDDILDYDHGGFVDLAICRVCGAIIHERYYDRHRQWHKEGSS
jgi:hypothetical protein